MPDPTTKDELHRLIQAADNARDKAYLLIMLDMHDSLLENTEVTHSIDNKLNSHIGSYNESSQKQLQSSAQSKGMWQATCFFLVILQSIFGFEYARLYSMTQDTYLRVSKVEVQAENNRLNIMRLEERSTGVR